MTKAFTEAETKALSTGVPVTVQARFWIGETTIVGTLPIELSVADMMGV